MASATIYTVGGTVQADRRLYLTRQVDDELLALCRAGTFAYVLSPRQLGKSSLMMRTARRLAQEGVRSVVIDLTQLGTQVTAEAWYLGLLAIIEDQLGLETSAVEWWKAHAELGVTQRLTQFFEEILLREVSAPIVIFVDEIDTTLSLTFTDDFFTSIRYFYQARIRLEEFQRLTFVLMGVATPGDLIRDSRRTPFNIGQRLDMTDFTLEEALPLADGLSLPLDEARQVLGWVLGWTGGHPYLTQRVCRAITEQKGEIHWTEAEVGELIANTFFGEKSEQDNNLQFVRDMLTRRTDNHEEVLTIYREIRANKRAITDEEQSLIKTHLKLSGVVKRESARLKVRNAIYNTVFDEKWIKEHLPVNWAKRLRRAFGIIAASLLLAVIMGGLAIFALVQQSAANDRASEALAARNTAEARRVEAENARTETERQSQISRAQALAANAVAQLEVDPERSILFAVEAVKLAQQPGIESVLPQANDALRQALEHSRLTRLTLDAHADRVYAVDYSPDGKYIVTAHNDGTAWLWDATTGKALATFKGHTGPLRRAKFSPDGHYILTTSIDGTVRTWEAPSGKALATLQSFSGELSGGAYGGSDGRGASFSPDSQLIATAGEDGVARVWEVQTGRLKLELKGHANSVNDASFSPDGKYIATAGEDTTAKLWDATSGQELATMSGHSGFVYRATFSPDGRYVVTASQDGTAMVFEIPSGKVVTILKGHNGWVFGASFSPDSRYVLTFSTDYTAKLWRMPDGKELVTYGGHTGRIDKAVFSPDGRYVITASFDHLTKIWETQTGKELYVFRGNTGTVNNATFSPDGRYVATASVDGTAKIWESLPGKDLATYFGQSQPFNGASFSPDGSEVVIASSDNSAKLWNIQSRLTVTTLQGHTDWVSSASFSPDGRYILTSSRDNTAKLWEAQSGKEVLTYTGHLGPVNGAAFSAEGKYIVTASRDQTARVWETQSGQTTSVLSGHTGDLTSASFSPDGRYVVTASIDGTAKIWEVASSKEIITLRGHLGPVNSAVFSPDGKSILTAGRDGTVRRWESQTGKEVNSFKGHSAEVNQASFSPDGRYLVTASADGTARVFEIATGKELATLKGHSGAVISAVFSPDGNYVVTTGADQTAQVQIVTAQELLRVAQSRLTRSLTPDERLQFGFDPVPSVTPPATTTSVALGNAITPTPKVTLDLNSSPTASATTVAPSTSPILTPLPGGGDVADLIEDVKFDGTKGKRGGELNLDGFGPVSFQPFYDGADQINVLVHASLLGVSDHAKYFPYLLAQVPTLANGSVKLSPDGKGMDLTLKLKPGLRWSDGSPLTSKDLAFTVKWVNDPDQSGIDTSVWSKITRVETPDNETAVLKFNQVFGPYLDFLANFIPLPEKAWSTVPIKNLSATSPESKLPSVTSGPFRVVEFVDGGRVTLIRNDYFSPVFGFNTYLDKIVYRVHPNDKSLLDSIAKGELDSFTLDKAQIDTFSKIPNSHIGFEKETAIEYLQLNLTNPLFQDKAVRQALDLALDKPALIALTPYPQTAGLSALVMLPSMLFANHSLQPTHYNPEAARQLLEGAGWKPGPDGIRVKNGQRLAFSLVSTDNRNRRQIAPVIVTYWKAIGVEVSTQLVYGADLFGPWVSNGKLARGQYDVGMFANTFGLDNDSAYINYHSSEIPSDANGGNGANYGRINNPQIDQALDLQRHTPDQVQRKAAWQTTIQQVLYEDSYEIPLYTFGYTYWISDRVKNYKPFNQIFWNAVEMYLD